MNDFIPDRIIASILPLKDQPTLQETSSKTPSFWYAGKSLEAVSKPHLTPDCSVAAFFKMLTYH
jgi:hypothetical protein